MRQKFINLVGFIGLLLFLGGVFWAIVKLQGPGKPIPVTPTPTSQGQKGELDMSASKVIETRSVEVSFSSGTNTLSLGSIPLLIVEKTATGTIQSIKPDLEAIKKEIMGKNNEELSAYLSTFSNIKNANVEYQPSFINSKIPSIANRVEIVLDK